MINISYSNVTIKNKSGKEETVKKFREKPNSFALTSQNNKSKEMEPLQSYPRP